MMFAVWSMLAVFLTMLIGGTSSRRERAAREAWKVRHPYKVDWK